MIFSTIITIIIISTIIIIVTNLPGCTHFITSPAQCAILLVLTARNITVFCNAQCSYGFILHKLQAAIIFATFVRYSSNIFTFSWWILKCTPVTSQIGNLKISEILTLDPHCWRSEDQLYQINQNFALGTPTTPTGLIVQVLISADD